MKQKSKILILFILILGTFLPLVYANAGTITSPYKYAWSDEVGYINFAPLNGGITVTNSALSGYAWSENSGYINFAPAQGGVSNDGNGNLSGSAWGENLGYIDFDNVSINTTTGKFSGTATGTLVGTINFDCPNYCDVRTDWRPSASSPSSGGGGGSHPVGISLNPPSSGLPVDVILSIPKNLQGAKNLGVYWFNETNKQWILIPDVKFSKKEATFKFYGKAEFKISNLNVSAPKTAKKTTATALPIKNKQTLDKVKSEVIQPKDNNTTKVITKTFIEKVIDFLGSIILNIFKSF